MSLIETIRVNEGRIENFDYHSRRMNDSSQAVFGDILHWKPRNFVDYIELPPAGVHKLRIVYDQNDRSYKLTPYKIRPVSSLKMVVDDDIVYDHKFENRDRIDRLFTMKGSCDDILIVKNGMITDVSYSNIIFKRDDEWFTPETFLLNGTMRQYLLDRGKIKQTKITPANLGDFSHFKLINALLADEAPQSEVSNIH